MDRSLLDRLLETPLQATGAGHISALTRSNAFPQQRLGPTEQVPRFVPGAGVKEPEKGVDDPAYFRWERNHITLLGQNSDTATHLTWTSR